MTQQDPNLLETDWEQFIQRMKTALDDEKQREWKVCFYTGAAATISRLLKANQEGTEEENLLLVSTLWVEIMEFYCSIYKQPDVEEPEPRAR